MSREGVNIRFWKNGTGDYLEALCLLLEVRPTEFAAKAVDVAIKEHLKDDAMRSEVETLVRARRRRQRRHLSVMDGAA